MAWWVLPACEVVLLGVLCGVVGVLVVLRRQTFVTAALTHATFPGAVLGVLLGVGVLWGAAVSAVVLVVLMWGLSGIRRLGEQVAAGVVLTFGFALGQLLLSLFRGVPSASVSLLTGSLLSVSMVDVVVLAAVTVASLLVLVCFWRPVLFLVADPQGFRAAVGRVWPFELLVYVLIGGTVVVALPAVGSLLAIALIAAPASAALLVSRRLPVVLWCSVGFGVGAGVLGLLLSWWCSVAAGAAIACVAAAMVGVGYAVAWVRRFGRRKVVDPVGAA